MKKTFAVENMPALAGSLQVTDAETIKNLGANTSAYSLREGDKVVFDIADENGNPVIYSRKVRAKDEKSPLAYYIAITKNGKESWLAISNLTRRNGHREYTCPLCEELAQEPSFVEMFKNKLAEKTIVCTSTEVQEFTKFKDGQPVDGEFDKRQTPILAWE